MWTELLRAIDSAAPATPDPWDMQSVAALLPRLTPLACVLAPVEAALRWGRYLVHADPRGRYNLQLDVFSRGYTGEVHAHGTWGMFWVLQGALLVHDHALGDGAVRLQRAAWLGPGSAQCFCPPDSDWHRVATPDAGPQTLSLHLYGPGFDLDTGLRLDAGGPRAYRRGPLRALAELQPHLQERRA